MVMLLIEQELDCINACLLKGVGIYFSQFIKHEEDPVLFFIVLFWSDMSRRYADSLSRKSETSALNVLLVSSRCASIAFSSASASAKPFFHAIKQL